jgi:death-on-curing protein
LNHRGFSPVRVNDGNKRTAFAVMDTFITLNGYSLNLSQEQAYNLVIQVVQREISKEELSAFLELHLQGK